MKQFTYTITDSLGIHARPAGMLVKEAEKYSSRITLERNEKSGNAKRIFSIMGLGVKCGDTVKVSVEGVDEEAAAAALEKFLKATL